MLYWISASLINFVIFIEFSDCFNHTALHNLKLWKKTI